MALKIIKFLSEIMKTYIFCLLFTIVYSASLSRREMPIRNTNQDIPRIERSHAFDEDDHVNPVQEDTINQVTIPQLDESADGVDQVASQAGTSFEQFLSAIDSWQFDTSPDSGERSTRPVVRTRTPPNANSVFRITH